MFDCPLFCTSKSSAGQNYIMFLNTEISLDLFTGIYYKKFVQYILISSSKNVYIFLNMSKHVYTVNMFMNSSYINCVNLILLNLLVVVLFC